jgi:hypothetical protein
MAAEEQPSRAKTEFVSTYGWLLAPGDHMQADYTSPTVVRDWLEANPLNKLATKDKQKAYGQWIAQLLQNQLGIPLVSLYRKKNRTEGPFTLSHDAIAAFTEYFEKHRKHSKKSQ